MLGRTPTTAPSRMPLHALKIRRALKYLLIGELQSAKFTP